MEYVLILAVAAILYAFFKWYVPNWKRRFNRSYERTIAKHDLRDDVDFFAKGGKPWGEPVGGTTHGSSYFLDTAQLIARNLANDISEPIPRNRIFLGKHATTRHERRKTIIQKALIYAPEQGHLITIAPTRSGKGASHVIPNLLSYAGSVVVNDIKSENAAVTARYRDEAAGHKVYRFAPFEENSASWNPLDFIADGGNKGSDASLMADMLIMDDGGEQAFWTKEAKSLLSGVIMYVMTEAEPEERTMETVRAHLTLSPASFQKMLDNMAASKEKFVIRAANGFMNATDKVQDSVKSTINSDMRIWDHDEVEAVTSKSDFRFEDLKDEPISIFFCIPPEHLDVYAPLMRLFFGQAIKAMSRNKAKPDLPVTFILDEFPQLGRMEPIHGGMAYLAGYGVRLWLFAQNLGQIKSVYGENDAQGIVANCSCRSFFGTNDPDTANLVSDYCGMMTVPVAGLSQNRPDGLNTGQRSNSDSISFTSQPLMTAQEITSMPVGTEQIVFIQGENPIHADLVRYYAYPEFFPPVAYDEWEGR